jgi:hypothetical protein
VRITIEMTEAESRSTTIHREVLGAAAAEPAAHEAAAFNGGPPPEPLLIALGARTEGGANAPPGPGDTDAGGPPNWLVDVITGGAARASE